MTVLTIGSVNIDHVYKVREHPKPGETLTDLGYSRGLGGKGANQSLAAALAGASVRHVGAVGNDGAWCREQLFAAGVDVTALLICEEATGHAVIMVDELGENTIVIHPGANRALTTFQLTSAVETAQPGDWMLLQNETNLGAESARLAQAKGMKVAYSAAPFEFDAAQEMIGLVDLMVVNEREADQLAEHLGCSIEEVPVPALLVTLGAAGAVYRNGAKTIHCPAFPVDVVDTTGAGDTYLGYFLAGLDSGELIEVALRDAAAAASLQIGRPGAADAIPTRDEVNVFLAEGNT